MDKRRRLTTALAREGESGFPKPTSKRSRVLRLDAFNRPLGDDSNLNGRTRTVEAESFVLPTIVACSRCPAENLVRTPV